MGISHILIHQGTPRPWWRADQRWDVPPDKPVFCACCNAYSPAEETEVRLMIQEWPIGGPGNYQGNRRKGFEPSYEEPYWAVRCGEGFGCTVSPRRRASRHLRER